MNNQFSGPNAWDDYLTALEQATPIIEAVLLIKAGEPLDPIDVDVVTETDAGPVRIVGALNGVWPTALLSYGYALLSGRTLLRLWLAHLVLAASERRDLPERSLLIGRQSPAGVARVSFMPPSEDPRGLLSDLAILHRAGATRPLRLLPNPSFEFIKHIAKRTPPKEALVKVRSSWNRRVESGDVRLHLAFRGSDLFGADPLGPFGGISMGFENLAERVFGPMLDAMEKGRA